MDEITWPEDAMRAATGGPQGFRAPNVSCNKRQLFGRIWPRRFTYAVTPPGVEREHGPLKMTYTHLLSNTDPHYVSCEAFGPVVRPNIPQRPPFQRAFINHVRSLQDCIGRWGQTHAGGGWDSQLVPGWSQSEAIQTLPDWVILYKQLQRVTRAVDKIVHLNKQWDLVFKDFLPF